MNKSIFLAAVVAATVSGGPEIEPFQINNAAEFRKCVAASARLERLATDLGFLEGPVWHPGGFLVFSDIPNDELKRWSPGDGVSTFRKPSHNANGNTLDSQGRLVTAEHTGRRVVVADRDGSLKSVVSQYDGKKLNSPNDVVVKSDGNYVFRHDAKANRTTVVATNCEMPNGLAFSPDEKKLYVADSSGTRRHVRVYGVKSDGKLAGGEVFCKIDKGGPDGIRCDAEGRV